MNYEWILLLFGVTIFATKWQYILTQWRSLGHTGRKDTQKAKKKCIFSLPFLADLAACFRDLCFVMPYSGF